MTFWRPFAFHLSSIDSILDRQTVTLEDILDEEQVLQETKNLNRKLINFLSQKDNLIKMIDYITIEREESADIKQRVRYPNISSEILCLENTHFSDIIYEDEALLDKIYAIITNDSKKTSSSLTLAVYCSKVACNMMQLKFIQTIEYLKKKDLITKLVTKFRYTPSLDVLLKAIYCEHTSPNHDLGVSQMLIEKELLASLIENFNGQHDGDSHEAAAQALIDLILICSRSPSSPIIRHLESKETGSKLISYSLSETNPSELIYGLSVVNELLRLHSIQADSEPQALPTFIETTISFIPHMMKMFVLSEEEEKLKTPIGEQKMFGFRRMKVLETLSALANTGYPDVFQAFFLKNVFKTCLEIFFEFPWNNFIHATIEQMLNPLSTSSPHLLELVRDLGLADRIVDITLQNQVEEQSNKPIFFRRGYMGHLFNISRLIETSSSSSEDLKTFLDGNEKWRLYIDTTYKETINKQKRPFVPSLPQNLGFSEDQTPADYGGAVDSNYIDFQDDFTDFLYPDEGELNYGDRQFDYQSEQANNFEDEDSEEDSEGDEDTDDEDEGVYSDEEQNTKLGS